MILRYLSLFIIGLLPIGSLSYNGRSSLGFLLTVLSVDSLVISLLLVDERFIIDNKIWLLERCKDEYLNEDINGIMMRVMEPIMCLKDCLPRFILLKSRKQLIVIDVRAF